jgi:hypothetical protein
MRTWTKNRWFSSLVAVGYMLTVTTASLFHNHAAHDGDGCCHGRSLTHEAPADCRHGAPDRDSPRPNAPKAPGECPSDSGNCPVCHFLSQKPAPAAAVAAVSMGTLVHEVSSPAPVCIVVGVFSAWHSRAPPVFA